MKRVVDGNRWEEERVVVWMPRERRMRRDSSVWGLDNICRGQS